jgi:hypothetical protein
MTRVWSLMIAALLLVGVGAAAGVYAQDDERAPDEAPADNGDDGDNDADDSHLPSASLRESFKDIEKTTGDVTFDADDMEAFTTHWNEFNTLLNEAQGDSTNLNDSIHKLLESDDYIEWAGIYELDAEAFARKSTRVFSCFVKLNLVPFFRHSLEQRRQMLEDAPELWEEDVLEAMKEEIEAQEADLEACQKYLDKIPGPNDAEKKLLEDNKDSLHLLIFGVRAQPEEAEDAEDEAEMD